MEINKIYQGNCLELMKSIDDKSIDLIIIDPPYNIGKAEWDKIKNYVEWMGQVFLELQRVLKDNGSFYFFHNDFLQIVELQNWINKNSNFNFKQLIIWNKKFKGVDNEGFLQGFNEVEGLNNYQKMVEYCLFYTKQSDEYVKSYFKNLLKLHNKKASDFNKWMWKNKFINNKSNIASHLFGDNSQVKVPSEYLLRCACNFFGEVDFKRYTFNNQKTHHSVWNYKIANKTGHITPKPVELIENIIKHSSNEGDIVLDCFIGSGTTAIACMQTNRNFIGMELEEKYVEIANNRIKEHKQQLVLV